MNVVIIISAIMAATVVSGTLVAAAFVRVSNLVSDDQAAVEKEKASYNPAVTMGHRIAVDVDVAKQLEEARVLAAKRAASLPRGANLRIGNVGDGEQPTALDGVEQDPITAVKIASVHGWQLLRTGARAASSTTVGVTQAGSETVAPTKSPDDLVPGEDYAFIEITDDMDPAEVRKARIANAKAKSAAIKALKAAGGATVAPVESAPQAPATAPSAAPAAASMTTDQAPQAGVDYPVIEIVEGMDPAEIRKARIANAKAKSAAMKAFKEAGGRLAEAAQEAPPGRQETAVETVVETSSTVEIPANISAPEYIEITDDMDPADIRKARIHNAKAKSAYNKALKAAGIDPASVKE